VINDIAIKESKMSTTIEQIGIFEELIQAKLPEDYKKFLLRNNGGHPTADCYDLIEPINPKNKSCSIDWFYALYDGEFSNLIKEFNKTRDQLPNEFIPIARDNANIICMSVRGDDYNKLYYWTTDWSYWQDEDYNKLYLIANSFSDFINGLYEVDYDENDNEIRKYQDGTIKIVPETPCEANYELPKRTIEWFLGDKAK
jgi:hypothetical protein